MTNTTREQRNGWLRAADTELLASCRVDVFRGSGRGGQKRNRTESAVRVTHLPSGLSATCDDTRSQHTNKHLALRKLREEIALRQRCRATPEPMPARPARKSPDYPLWTAGILDVLEEAGYRLSDAAATLGTSTSRLGKELAGDTTLWQTVNQGRERHGLTPLRKPG